MRKLNLIERRMSMRKKYVKPTIKSVEWKFQNPVCVTMYEGSPCIKINETESQTRLDHVQSFGHGDLGEWNVVGSNNGSDRW